MNEIPSFKKYFAHYLHWLEETTAKSPLTIARERSSLRSWAKFMKTRELLPITLADLNAYALWRKRGGVSNRGVNVDVTALANLLHFAKTEGLIAREVRLVTEDWTPLKYVAPRRSLITGDTLQRLVTEARSLIFHADPLVDQNCESHSKYENGSQLADLLLFIAYSGARRQAALSAKWENVDWKNRQVTLFTKFDKRVVVDFNEKLEAHLKSMCPVVEGHSPWLFPSPLGVGHLANPQDLLANVCKGAGVEGFRLHDLRHFFISHCVMAGVDSMTTAEWVGHSDGGVLIGKVYGHLNPQHRRDSAEKVKF